VSAHAYELGVPEGLDHELLTAERERELALKARTGCVASRDELIRHSLKLIWGEARKYFDEDTDEYFLVGCLAALKALSHYDPDAGRLAPYLRVVCRRAMWNARRPEEEAQLLEVYSTDDVEAEPVDETLLRLVHNRLAAAELDPTDASVVALYHGIGDGVAPHSQRGVAAELGISRARVQQRLARALTKLRASFLAAGQSTWEDVLREIEHD
jgi:RNA polymerase sigma factor (sigma-70 family)